MIVLDIADGWHINPNPAPDEFAIATELTMKSKLKVAAKDVTFPEPEEVDVPGLKKKILIYSKQIEIRGFLEVPAAAAGKMEELEFRVKYQACNEKSCLAPTTLSLKVPVAVAKQGERVRLINKKLFEPQQ